MRKMNIYEDAKYYWGIYGSFGMVKGKVEHDGGKIFSRTEDYLVVSERRQEANGLVYQTGYIENVSDKPITIRSAMTKFVLEGGEYQVYTQQNHWQNESHGAWQKLHNGVIGKNYGVRDCFGSAPVVGVWDDQTGRGIAFHILAAANWQYTVSELPYHDSTEALKTEIDIGICNRDFTMDLQPGEQLRLPDILWFEIRNPLDLDCWKLHRYMNTNYPRKPMPVLFNNWLCDFGDFNYESTMKQIPRAAELGCEYFVIDSGWYGKNPSWSHRGEWWEKKPGDGAFEGRMGEISEQVRKAGMKFGFWIEPESAGVDSDALKAHPDWYFEYDGLVMLNFAIPEARAHAIDEVCALVEKYHAGFIKFDFNNDIRIDYSHKSYVPYFEGYRAFADELNRRLPDVYLSNCAAGGQRMSLPNYERFPSFWFTDNQSPFEGLKIIKDTLRRMPSQAMERWLVASTCDTHHAFTDQSSEIFIATDDATWNNARSLSESFLEGFMLGGPMGFSCDLTSFSKEHFAFLKKLVADFKADREFWSNAECRILCDTNSVLTLQYNDFAMKRIEIVSFAWKIHQRTACIYPVTAPGASYRMGEKVLTSEQLTQDGITADLPGNYVAARKTLLKI